MYDMDLWKGTYNKEFVPDSILFLLTQQLTTDNITTDLIKEFGEFFHRWHNSYTNYNNNNDNNTFILYRAFNGTLTLQDLTGKKN